MCTDGKQIYKMGYSLKKKKLTFEEYVNLEKQNVDWWFPGSGLYGGTAKFSFRSDEKVLELQR